jgi:subtilisin family serine protease
MVPLFSDADIDGPEAWDITTGSRNVVVATIDSGIDYTHEDLAANMWRNEADCNGNGIDDDGNGFVDDCYGIAPINGNSDPFDDHSHGTHVAGTIGAVGNNGIGVVGVNWNVQVVSCKFLNARGSGFASDAAECLDYFRALKQRGVNFVLSSNSWGGGADSQTLRDAILADEAAGILFIAAAGNDRTNTDDYPHLPSSIRAANVVSVAATDHSDYKASFSNYGRTTVHVAAPGVDIVSLRAAGTDMYGDGSHFVPEGAGTSARYLRASGTSMATPHVSGLAALIQAANPGLPWWAVRNLLLAGGDPLASISGITATGRRINAYGSLTCQDRFVFAPVQYPTQYPEYQVGKPTVLKAYAMNCADPAAAVWVTTSSGPVIGLRDDGVEPDEIAGDGLFSGYFTPTTDVDDLGFSSTLGAFQTGRIPSFLLTTPFLESGKLLTTYEAQLDAVGVVHPLTWTLAPGSSLPPGLTLSASGKLSGIG